jgi:hypothetical protein
MNEITCCHCGHVWEAINAKAHKKTFLAKKVNGEGPFCGLCRTLEEATRFAAKRKLVIESDIRMLRNSLKKTD